MICASVEIAAGPQFSPEYVYSVKQKSHLLTELIDTLPEAYREAVKLRILEGSSYQEIAGQLNIPISTVSTKIHKGKGLLLALVKSKGVLQTA